MSSLPAQREAEAQDGSPRGAFLVLTLAALCLSALRVPEQLADTFGVHWINAYNATNWVLGWDEGFVHRGLLGTLLGAAFGRTSMRTLLVINLALTAVYLCAVSLGVLRLYRRAPGEPMFLLLLAALVQPSLLQWWFSSAMFARIDLCIVLGTLLSLRVVLMPREALLYPALAAIATVCMLIHEGFGVLFLPLVFAALLVVRTWRSDERAWRPCLFYLLPMALVWLGISLAGRPGIPRPAFVAMLQNRAADFRVDDLHFVTALFIEHGRRIELVLGRLVRGDTLFRVAGTVLLFVPTLLLMGRLWRAAWETAAGNRPRRRALACLLASACAPLGSFLLGFDFMRWLGYWVQTQVFALGVLAFVDAGIRGAFLNVAARSKPLIICIVLLGASVGVPGVTTSYPLVEFALDLVQRTGMLR